MRSVAPSNKDDEWDDVRRVLDFYALESIETNAQKCHLIGRTMIQEVTKPELYNTPVRRCWMRPEDGMYLFPEFRRTKQEHKIFKWNMDFLFPTASSIGLSRVQNFLTSTGTHYFIACTRCNEAHTGDKQLQAIFKTVFNGRNREFNDVFIMYTLIFDSMADSFGARPASIKVNKRRMKCWNVEIWLNYCGFMLMAQFYKVKQMASTDSAQLTHMFENAHKDMGLCDFYLNKMLAAILYVNYSVDVDFIWLHQNFLVHLPAWAKSRGLFETCDNHFNCMWRWVLGVLPDIRPDEGFLTMQDIGTVKERGACRYHRRNCHIYYLNGTPLELAKRIVDGITLFSANGLPEIAAAINPSPDAPPVSEDSTDLKRLFQRHCREDIRKKLIAVQYQMVDARCLLHHVMMNPTLEVIHSAFKQEFGDSFRNVLYGNYVTISLVRTRCAFTLIGLYDDSNRFVHNTWMQLKQAVLVFLSR